MGRTNLMDDPYTYGPYGTNMGRNDPLVDPYGYGLWPIMPTKLSIFQTKKLISKSQATHKHTTK
jgi:hypothetical protein